MKSKRLNFVSRYLTVWIFLAMGLGLLLGWLFPALSAWLSEASWGHTNLFLAFGLIVMMYPPLAKVDYKLLPSTLLDTKVTVSSLLLNWIIGPLLMFALAWFFLREQPEYMNGLILVGLARCIAMVIVWNDLAGGDRNYAAGLVALNSIFQVFFYALYAWIFMYWLPEKLGNTAQEIEVSTWEIFQSVLIYLGIPFFLGFLSRIFIVKRRGKDFYERKFLPKISPYSLWALLFTIVFMFSLKSALIIRLIYDVLYIALPLLLYFGLMFFVSFFWMLRLKTSYAKNVAVAFTAAGNNFELAIAVSIGAFGLNSGEALVGVVGPLVEVPALILLVQVARSLKKRFY